MQIRSYSPLSTSSGIRISPLARRVWAGSTLSMSGHTRRIGKRENRFGKPPIREFDLGRMHVVSSLAEHLSRGLKHLERLPGVTVVKEQDPRPRVAVMVIGHVRHFRTFLSISLRSSNHQADCVAATGPSCARTLAH